MHACFRVFGLVSWVTASSLVGCAQGGAQTCASSADCPAGQRCVDDMCLATHDAGARDAASGGPGPESGDAGLSPTPDGSMPAPDGSMAACTSAADCDDGNACTTDSCDASTGCTHTPLFESAGSCASPIDISAGGSFTGDTTCAASNWSGVCLGTSAPDAAFVLDLTSESDVHLDASGSSFPAALFVGSSCGDASAACDSDGTPTLSVRLPAGRHHVGLDGLAPTARGTFQLDVQLVEVRQEVLTFPTTSDVRATLHASLWNAGDAIQGSRTTDIPSISSAELTLSVSPNGLNCDNQDMQLSINGTVVGPVTITPGLGTFTRSYSFAPITGPTYTIRLQTIRTVSTGCGAAGFPDGVSTLRIRG